MTRDEATTALHAYLHGLDEAALKRVRDAGPRKWTVYDYCTGSGRRCLLGHAEDWAPRGADPPGSRAGCCPGENAFHELVDADGLAVTVASIRLLATTLLRERELAALTAFCPLAAREETPCRG